MADLSLLKWGLPRWRKELLDKHGVDYGKTPAEDFATGMVTYRNPETGQLVKGQFTVSWMYDKQGLRLALDGLGPGLCLRDEHAALAAGSLHRRRGRRQPGRHGAGPGKIAGQPRAA